jgi:hypothetical protein
MQDDENCFTDDAGDPSGGRMSQYMKLINSLCEQDRARLKDQQAEQIALIQAQLDEQVQALMEIKAFEAKQRFLADARVRDRPFDLPPGVGLSRFLAALLSRSVFATYVRPTIADMQHEYIEAVADDPACATFWIKVRGYASILLPFMYALVAPLVRAILPGSKSA